MSALKYLIWVNSYSKDDEGGQTDVSAETGFVSLTPEQRILITVGLHIAGNGILIEVGQEGYIHGVSEGLG